MNDGPRCKKGERVRLRMPPDRRIVDGIIKDEVCRRQSDFPDKELRLQLIEFDGARTEIRFGYYIKGKKPGRLGKWVWGQYAANSGVAALVVSMCRDEPAEQHHLESPDACETADAAVQTAP